MLTRYASLLTGVVLGFAVAFLVVLAATRGDASREPDPTFDVDLFDRPTATPAPDATSSTHDSRRALGRLLQRLETLRDGESTGSQEASNALAAAQDAAAVSGTAEAVQVSYASTGDTRAWLSGMQKQVNRQIVID